MTCFPLFVDTEQKQFLVVGDGAIARRKIRYILQFSTQVRVITNRPSCQEISEELDALEQEGVFLMHREFEEEDLRGIDLCVASSDDRALNHRIAVLCREAKIPVNVPDDPSICTFFLPAVTKRGDLVVAVSTGGRSPALAGAVRQRIEDRLPDKIEMILDRMGELRTWVPEVIQGSADRGRLYKAVLEELLDGSLSPEETEVNRRARELMEPR